ncbi:MAG TPA: hypothetical protein ENJ45_02695 [Phaeodactylibacter sp.]|nr:hypothetical protein [Phaeodactylibacter sp.]
MEQNNFEKNIKDTFENNQPMLNTDEIWSNIEPQLKKKKKRRFLFFWFLFAGIGMGLAFLFFNLNNSHNASTHSVDAYSDSATPQSHLSDRSSDEGVLADTLTESTQTNNNTQQQGVEKKNIKKHKQTPIRKNIINNNYGLKKNYIATNTKFAAVQKKILREKTTPNSIEQNSISADTASVIPIQPPPASAPGEQLNKQQHKLSSLSDKKVTDINKKKKKTKKKKKRWKFIIPIPKIQLRPYAEIGAGPILPMKILQTTGVSTGANLRNKRKESERQLEAFGSHLGLQLQSKSGVFILAGIQWQQLNERFDYKNETIEIRSIQDTISYTENLAGEVTSAVLGEVDAQVTTIRTIKKSNRHRFGYFYYGIGKRWFKPKGNFALSIGMEDNFFYDFKGTILNKQFEPTTYERKKYKTRFDDVFRRQTGWSLWLAAEFNRRINHRTQWAVSPKIQLPLKSISNSDYPLNQKYLKLSVDVGIRVLLLPTKKKNKKTK